MNPGDDQQQDDAAQPVDHLAGQVDEHDHRDGGEIARSGTPRDSAATHSLARRVWPAFFPRVLIHVHSISVRLDTSQSFRAVPRKATK